MSKPRKVRLFKPSVGDEELAAIREVFDRSWLGLGPKVAEFETKWSSYVGAADSIGVNSGTAALHLALAAFRFEPGSRVLVPALTFASTATAVLYNQLEPVFVDSDPVTLGLSLDDLERKWTPDCVAVMPVHFAGHPVPMDELLTFAESKDLKVIEDCAHCSGGAYQGRKLGTLGDIGCFSFEEKKGMTSGDGGMLSSEDAELIAPLRAQRWVGIDKDTWKRAAAYTDVNLQARHWYYEIALLGYKYNMNDLAASIGLVQLGKLDGMNQRRGRSIQRYLDGISDLETIEPLLPYALQDGGYWVFGVRCDSRDELIAYLKERGIATGVHYMPLPMHPLFKPYANATPVVDEQWERLVTLPLFADIEDEDVDYVIEALRSYAAD